MGELRNSSPQKISSGGANHLPPGNKRGIYSGNKRGIYSGNKRGIYSPESREVFDTLCAETEMRQRDLVESIKLHKVNKVVVVGGKIVLTLKLYFYCLEIRDRIISG